MKILNYVLMSSCCVLLLACGAGPDEPQELGAPDLELRLEKKLLSPSTSRRPRTETSWAGLMSTLSNGVPITNLSGAYDSQQMWTLQVPAGATNLVVTTDFGSGDADLYVRYGAPPRTVRSGDAAYDCVGYSATNTERCTFDNPQAGTWYIMVHGFRAFSGVTLTATYRMPSVLGSWNANIELAKPACTLVQVKGFPSVCFNPSGAALEPGLTLTYKLPTTTGTVMGSQTLTSNMAAFVLYNTRSNQTFSAATFEELGLTFPAGAPTSLCRDRLAVFSSPAPAPGWPQGGVTRVESGEAWGGTGFPKYSGVDVTAAGALKYQHPCRTTVEFRAQ